MEDSEKKQQFQVRIVYDNGYVHDFWVHKFSVKGGVWSWESVSTENDPVVLGVDHIIAVWQIGVRDV